MKKINRYIIILFCFIIWIIILAYLINYENLKTQKSVAQYVLIDEFHYWKYTNSKWEKLDSVNNFDGVAEEINWKKYDIYVNNQYFNSLDYVLMDGEEYYFDDDTHSYEIKQEKILFNDNTYFNLKKFNLVALSNEDMNIINEFLVKNSHSNDYLTIQNKYLIDENNAIYIVSNYPNYYPKYNSNLFYMAFYRRNDKNYLLLDIGYRENLSSYKLAWVIDAKNKFDNFILSYTCEEITCYDMYEYRKGKYIKVVGT